MFQNCGQSEDEAIPRINFDDNQQLTEISKKKLGDEVVAAFGGFFDDSPQKKIAAMLETDENISWGIKFVLLKEAQNKLEVDFQSRVLSGSFKECFLDKIKFPSFGQEMLYYNSQGYFMGTGGGEIFSYIVDFENKEIYHAHFVAESKNQPSLFISKNSTNKDIRDFFTRIFKNDYPSLRIVDEDLVLE